MPEVSPHLRAQVRARAGHRCEYCGFPERWALEPHEVDHIIALKHDGETILENLAWCCTICNGRKGSDLSSLDPESGALTRLFHPRRDRWEEHFDFRGAEIWPLTAVGRVTVRLLRLNASERIQERALMVQAGEALR